MKKYHRFSLLLLFGLFSFFLAGCNDKENTKGEVLVEDSSNGNTPKFEIPSFEIPTIEPPKVENPKGERPIEGKPTEEPPRENEGLSGLGPLLDEHLLNFEKAVNEGAFSAYISFLIDPESDFYDEQAEYVLYCYENNIKEELINYQIGSPVQVSDDSYEITVLETYHISSGNEGREEVKDFENTYTVKGYDYGYGPVWLIADLKVKVLEE